MIHSICFSVVVLRSFHSKKRNHSRFLSQWKGERFQGPVPPPLADYNWEPKDAPTVEGDGMEEEEEEEKTEEPLPLST